MKKKILIIGNSANAYSLARKLSEEHEVYVAPGSDTIKDFATSVDIREDSAAELIEFVVETGIDITIPITKKSISANLLDIFEKNQLVIFAPPAQAFNLIADKANAKKLLYKLHIPTPRFGIFEKSNMVIDYIKNLKKPFVLKTNEPSSSVILTSLKEAKTIVESSFAQKGQKMIIEDYVSGLPFNFYVMTDGYKALPIGSSLVYKHSLDGNGGQLTSGMGACAPNYKLSVENEDFLMNNVVYPLIEYFENQVVPYVGFLGVSGILLDDGSIQVLGFDPFMLDCDSSAVLELLDVSLISLIESCTLGIFSDEVDYIPIKDLSATSLVLNCNYKDAKDNVIFGLDAIDDDIIKDFYSSVVKNKYLEYEAKNGPVAVLTAVARTNTTSTQKVYEEAKSINYNGITYRKDLCKPYEI